MLPFFSLLVSPRNWLLMSPIGLGLQFLAYPFEYLLHNTMCTLSRFFTWLLLQYFFQIDPPIHPIPTSTLLLSQLNCIILRHTVEDTIFNTSNVLHFPSPRKYCNILSSLSSSTFYTLLPDRLLFCVHVRANWDCGFDTTISSYQTMTNGLADDHLTFYKFYNSLLSHTGISHFLSWL